MTAIMERSLSSDPLCTGMHRHGSEVQSQRPPWEQQHATKVPFMAPYSRPLTQSEYEALPSQWTTNRQQDNAAAYRMNRANNSTGVRTPLTAPPLTLPRSPPPVPKGPHNTLGGPQLQAFVPQGPPSPPESSYSSRSSTKSSGKRSGHDESPRRSRPMTVALPGTMSARVKAASPDRTRSHRRDVSSPKDNAEAIPLGKRLKLALKDMFKRDPVDESNLERIEDRHWTDE